MSFCLTNQPKDVLCYLVLICDVTTLNAIFFQPRFTTPNVQRNVVSADVEVGRRVGPVSAVGRPSAAPEPLRHGAGASLTNLFFFVRNMDKLKLTG
jgi:hypothetical protein